MYLYLLHYAPLNLTKIGISKNPTVRKRQVGFGRADVKILAIYNLVEARALETELHRRFSDCRITVNLPTNEWFVLDKLKLRNLMIELKRLEQCQ